MPDWVEVRHRDAALLLLAPHGGRRTSPRYPGRDKVNDLHTAELTRELATTCGATSIVNGVRDRNEIDLNRVEEVRHHAPWLLDLIADTLEHLVAQSGGVTLLVIHGWNVIQSVCDVGIGLVERDGRCLPAGNGHATASERFLEETVRPLQRLAARHAIAVTIGARYPAAHPNNLLQLFTPARIEDPHPAIRRIAALADRVNAVQVELGIPLRWPGPRRTAFTALLARVLRRAESERRAAASQGALPPTTLACGGRIARRRALQFIDAELIGMTSIDAGEAGGVAGRLLLSVGSDHLALFTGELARRGGAGLSIPHLDYVDDAGGGLRVRYAGPLLAFPTLTPFLDLESGLARGELVEAALDSRFTPDRAARAGSNRAGEFGGLDGTLVLGDVRRRLHARAYATHGLPRGPNCYPFVRLTLPDTSLGGVELTSHGPPTGPSGPGQTSVTLALTGTSEHGPLVGACELVLGSSSGHARLTVGPRTSERRQLEATLERFIPVR
ncbi:MAG: hypothetical protein ACREQL_05965, partial [Candidatus Binatia bacterium]